MDLLLPIDYLIDKTHGLMHCLQYNILSENNASYFVKHENSNCIFLIRIVRIAVESRICNGRVGALLDLHLTPLQFVFKNLKRNKVFLLIHLISKSARFNIRDFC